MKQILALIKPYLRWFILGSVLFFLAQTVKNRFAEVAAIRITASGWLLLALSIALTIAAHVWSGWVWTLILAIFKQPLGTREGVRVYLLTNIAKYSPGNIWHFYGRISAVSQSGSKVAATLSVLLEPLLMAAAALLIGLVSSTLGGVKVNFGQSSIWFQLAALIAVLVGIQPRMLNPLLHRLSRSKNKTDTAQVEAIQLTKYPLAPFLGEMGFVMLRGLGFTLTFMALQSITWQQIPQLFTSFSFAWLLGLIVPGAPGGLGVFEVTAYGLLDNAQFPTEIAAVALYRLISILAEAIAALACFRSKNN